MRSKLWWLAPLIGAGAALVFLKAHEARQVFTVKAADGVEIAYESAGDGEPALVFIHGAFADRTFWYEQWDEFTPRRRVILIDLAGHGESGRERRAWDIGTFAADVKAVLDKEGVKRAVLIGNSMGGPVALAAAALLPGRAVSIVAVDTFQVFAQPPAGYFEQQAEAFRKDFSGSMKRMVKMLFHADADPSLVARVEAVMQKGQADVAPTLFASFARDNLPDLARRVTLPIRCINGDLYPTAVEANKAVHPDFAATILPHTGHYPQLENPKLFNETLAGILKELEAKK